MCTKELHLLSGEDSVTFDKRSIAKRRMQCNSGCGSVTNADGDALACNLTSGEKGRDWYTKGIKPMRSVSSDDRKEQQR